jgi:hypothetical protein
MTPEARSQKIAMMAVIAGMIELPPAWIVEIIFGAELASEALCDPPPCHVVADYKKVFQPHTSGGLVNVSRRALTGFFSGPVSNETVALYQWAIDSQTSVAADEVAVPETVNRRWTARMKRDEEASQRQERQFRQLIARTARDKEAANVAWKALLDHLHYSEIGDKVPLDTARGLETLRNRGFSAPKIRMMRRLGMTAENIELVKRIIAETASLPPIRSFAEAIRLVIRLNEHNEDIKNCYCEEP